MTRRPTLFIGSSGENLEVAHALHERLEGVAEVTVWDQGIFELSRTALDSLLKQLSGSDFGAFVFIPDDLSIMRDEEMPTVRDNVIFELGLFVGRLGPERSFILTPKGPGESLHLPTDLLGLTTARYDANREDGNLAAALGPSATKMAKAISKLGRFVPDALRESDTTDGSAVQATRAVQVVYSDADCLNALETWMGKRPATENTDAIHFAEVDQQLDFPPGTTKRLIKQAASRWNYIVHREGEYTILFQERVHASPSGRRRLTDGFW